MSEDDRSHRWEEELPAYALGALEPSEEKELEEHLAGCEHCRERLRWLQPAVDVLPASVEQHRPPRSMRRRVMATVREEARAERGGQRRWWRGDAITFSLRPALALGAAALLTAGVIGYGLSSLGGDEPAAPIQASVEREDGDAVLRVSELPEPEGGEVYQAWFQVRGEMRPSVTFTPDAEGMATADLGQPPGRTRAVLVTAEPAGGSEEPTGEPIATAPVS
jgi:anti-sigma factor RsiW